MAAFAEASRIWSYRLSDAQRIAWARYATAHPLMVPCRGYRYLSGQGYFSHVNVPRILAGQSVRYWP